MYWELRETKTTDEFKRQLVETVNGRTDEWRQYLIMSFADNLTELRKYHDYSQEELAELIGVSRQTLSKYETGESLPDIEKCKLLADVFQVSIDDLISFDKGDSDHLGLGVPPKGKHVFGMVKVGDKGQIVIPAKARKIFDINPGDNLIILGDEGQGIAIIKEKGLLNLLNNARKKK